MKRLDSQTFEIGDLMREHPPVCRGNKRIVYEIACPPDTVHSGTLEYLRYPSDTLPDEADPSRARQMVDVRDGFYDYMPVQTGAVQWHVNFADPILFGFYHDSLFAQDEIQVAEHPCLGSMRDALAKKGRIARTAEDQAATPVLIMGAQRRCRVATEPDKDQGRPDGLYGNRFAYAPEDAVRRATTRIDPPTRTNLIAIAAPSGGYGTYDRETVEEILVTAYSGFGAAVRISKASTVVHTGFWGCGAFGGNRELMILLQIVAAQAAGVSGLVFHAGDQRAIIDVALGQIEGSLSAMVRMDEIIDWAVSDGRYQWGVGDGN